MLHLTGARRWKLDKERFQNYHYLALCLYMSINEGAGRVGCWGGTATVSVLEHGSGFVSEHGFTETKKMKNIRPVLHTLSILFDLGELV
jgi:hypothetical protein